MNFNKKEMIVNSIRLTIFSLLTIGSLIILLYCVFGDDVGTFIIVPIAMLFYFGVMTWASYSALRTAAEKYKSIKDSGLLNKLENLNPYKTVVEMRNAFKEQKKNCIYADEDFIITEDFFASLSENSLLITNGILDVKTLVSKVNGVIEYVSLSVLYYDGEKYEFEIRRPLGISHMKEKVNSVQQVANIIANKSENFRKYPSCTF